MTKALLRSVLMCLWVLAGTGAFHSRVSAAPPAKQTENRWEAEVRAYEKRDAENPPPKDAILFVGSSTVRMWNTLAEDFKPLNVLGRGIGGSQIADQIHFAQRLVIRYHPSQIVFYAGDNDVWSGKSAEQILDDYKTFVAKVRRALPDVPIHFLAIKPSPSRRRVLAESQKANRLVRKFAETDAKLTFIDVAAPLLDAEGKPCPDFFLKDMLHMNRKGYQLWVPIVRAAIEPPVRPSASKEKSGP